MSGVERTSALPPKPTGGTATPPPARGPGSKTYSALGPPNPTITQTRHLSLERTAQVEDVQQSNRFSIYDLKAVKREILTVFDAAENGDNRSITKFSKIKNFDVDAKDRYGRTALIWAADCGHLHAVETLVRLGASIHAADSHTNRTAIHWAARAGNLPIVKFLVQYGADFKREDRFGLTPLFLAKSKGYEGEEVFKYLMGEGAPYNETKVFDAAAAEAAEAEIAAEMARLADADAKAEETAATSSAS